MYTSKQSIKSLLGRRSKLALTLLIVTISLTQIFSTQLAFADNGGYPWIDATALSQATSDYGYSTCPSSDSTCKNYPSMNYVFNGTTYGEADPWIYNLRNCTSYVAWKINQVFGVSVQGWGNATSWDTSAAGHYTVYTGSSHTPQVGEIAQWDAGTGHVAYVYAVNNGIASLDEYNVGLDGLFYSNRTTASGSAGTPDHYIHIKDTTVGPFTSAPASFTDASGNLNVFVLTSGGINHYEKAPGGSWVGEIVATGSFTSTPLAYVDSSGNYYVYAETSGGINEYKRASAGSSWGGAAVASGTFTSAPAGYVDSSGNNNVYVKTSGGINHYVQPSGGSWGGEVVATGTFTAGLTAFVDASNNYNVFATTSGGINHYVKPSGGSWAGEVVTAGSFTSSPLAFVDASSNYNVFVFTSGGLNHYEQSTGTWAGEVVSTGS